MQNKIKRLMIGIALCVGPAAIIAGCASMGGEKDITLAQASEPAQATITKGV
jgi:hypothetical protein